MHEQENGAPAQDLPYWEETRSYGTHADIIVSLLWSLTLGFVLYACPRNCPLLFSTAQSQRTPYVLASAPFIAPRICIVAACVLLDPPLH